MLIKSRAKRTITLQLDAGMQSPTHPLTRLLVRRTRRARNAVGEPVEQRVPVDLRLPSSVTILPGQQVDLPDAIRELEQFKACLASRELSVVPAPTPDAPPPPPRKRRTQRTQPKR